ncbi:DUF4331 domain-containing protein [Mycolicibacterium cosmeticum]|uniref:DUF4331 domain-containing protein n=1 Tax=Mycolicibacterium cosmeticum TaxID=258533 RepID=W9ATP8_MYCCO|nr:DUF4331 family protein [Mycolicibacterium cosmeticum]TLH73257.1 DUF4331 domain-containing protein [Mycolicibacterium cosmeticum]CDO08888.1 hypothetical protein BN977_03708 [Mycolicibacterium cosmeticum]
MSHHLDSPIARQDIRLDITDLYLFRGESGTVLIINVCHSMGGDIPAPGFHPEGMYELKIDLDGDAIEDLTYRFTFTDRTPDERQDFTLLRTSGAQASDPFADGTRLLAGTTGQETTGATGIRVWAGRAGDPFWIEPDVLHAIGHAVQDGTALDLSGWRREQATNLFAGHSVYSLVLEVPDTELTSRRDDGRIGVWAVASLGTDAGGWRSINRVGLPMIHPLFTQFDERLGDDLNAGQPRDDYATYGPSVAAKLAAVIAAHGTATDPQTHGAVIAARLFPNILPYTVGTPAAFSFAGFNGRSLIDNAPDVMFSLVTNTPVSLGIGKESVTTPPTTTFPYVPVLR